MKVNCILSKVALPILLAISLSLQSYAQLSWNKKDLYGGDVRVIYAENNIIYAGTANGGLYYSLNNGSNWIYFDFGVHTVRSIVVLPSDLVLAGTDKGLFYKPFSGGSGGLALVENPVTALIRNLNGDIYAGTGSGVYKSTDGINWIFSGIVSSTIRSLAVINGNIYAGTSGQGIYRSTNNGTTWSFFGLGTTYVRSIKEHTNGNIFAGTWGGVQRYNGSQWVAAGLQGLDVPDISIDINGNIYAATWEGVFKSTNLGANWELLGFNESITWSVNAFDNFILIGRDGDGIYKSTNSGLSWASSDTGLCAVRVWKLEIKNNLMFAGASSGAYRSDDYGNTWTKVLNYNHANRFWSFLIVSSLEILAGGSNGIYRSTDGGISWIQFALASVSVKAIKKNPINNYLFAGTTAGVYRSTDNGLNWNVVNGGLTNINVNDLEILPDGVILAATGGGSGVYRSYNNGGLWFSANTGMTSFFVYDLFRDVYGGLYSVTSQTVFYSDNNSANWAYYNSAAFSGEALSTIFVDSVGNKFIGSNFGFYFGLPDGSWLLAVIGPQNIQSIVQDELGFVYLGTLGRGVYKSEESFIPVQLVSFSATIAKNSITLRWITSSELNNFGFEIERKPHSDINWIWEKIGFVDGNGTTSLTNYYSFTEKVSEAGKYLYRLKQIDFDGTFTYSNEIEVEIELPASFILEQNFPNPFNPTTIIGYSIPTDSYVTLSIFNSLGEKVASLVNDFVTAGYHKQEWHSLNSSGEQVSSGIYFYRIEMTDVFKNKFSDTKKMLLVR